MRFLHLQYRDARGWRDSDVINRAESWKCFFFSIKFNGKTCSSIDRNPLSHLVQTRVGTSWLIQIEAVTTGQMPNNCWPMQIYRKNERKRRKRRRKEIDNKRKSWFQLMTLHRKTNNLERGRIWNLHLKSPAYVNSIVAIYQRCMKLRKCGVRDYVIVDSSRASQMRRWREGFCVRLRLQQCFDSSRKICVLY